MQFEAKKIDIDLELTTLNGEEVTLKPKVAMSTEGTYGIMKAWTKLEEKQSEDSKGLDRILVLSEELACVYPKEAIWFRNNFDLGTLGSILEFIATTIAAIRKKDKS